MTKKTIFFLIVALLPIWLPGQTGQTLTEKDLLKWVAKYHPLAKRAMLQTQKGGVAIRTAKGAFDPYLYSELDQKSFDDKNYYSLFSGGLKVATPLGVKLKAGYDRSTGIYLNPENNVPTAGLMYAGASLPLGQGLLIDKRRAALKQAKIFAEATLAQQQIMLNDLFFDAIKQYWNWVSAWNQAQVYEESLELSRTRYTAVRQSFNLGDKPAIDTLEAFLQVQNRQLLRDQFRLEYQNQTVNLSNYLWYDNNTPLEITDSMQAPVMQSFITNEPMSQEEIQFALSQIAASHPEMLNYDYKLRSAEVDRRLKADKLKPKFNLNYNLLSQAPAESEAIILSPQNYKWGFEFSFPLWLREQRGDLQMTKLKIRETTLDQQQKLLSLQNKLTAYYNEQITLLRQIELYENAVENYRLLLQGERRKFDAGESSLFLVNSRENSYIQAQLKLIELRAKYQKASIGIQWAQGQLFNQ